MSPRTFTVFVMALGVMLVSGSAFVNKMIDFVFTMSDDGSAAFGVVAVATYLGGMVPIVCVMLWAVCTGRFREVERPAERMLQLHRQIEAGEAGHGR